MCLDKLLNCYFCLLSTLIDSYTSRGDGLADVRVEFDGEKAEEEREREARPLVQGAHRSPLQSLRKIKHLTHIGRKHRQNRHTRFYSALSETISLSLQIFHYRRGWFWTGDYKRTKRTKHDFEALF